MIISLQATATGSSFRKRILTTKPFLLHINKVDLPTFSSLDVAENLRNVMTTYLPAVSVFFEPGGFVGIIRSIRKSVYSQQAMHVDSQIHILAWWAAAQTH